MNDAWAEGAAAVTFNGITQSSFLADIDAAAAADAAIADREVELKMKPTFATTNTPPSTKTARRSAKALPAPPPTATTARTTLAMGFVRKSEKKSGLTRKKKP